MAECTEFVPDGQATKWPRATRDAKKNAAKKIINNRSPQDYQKWFDQVVEPLNVLAKKIPIADVMFLLAQSAHESSWLDQENFWLNNPLGVTQAGGLNLGYDSIQQAVDHWECLYADRVRGAKTIQQYINGLQGKGLAGNKKQGELCDAYNSKKGTVYEDPKYWDKMYTSVKIRMAPYGYERVLDGSVWVLRKKAADGTKTGTTASDKTTTSTPTKGK
jgi:hypothetical protein